jgi:hypothetical protein
MSKATDKLSRLMSNLKKLPANRRAYWLAHLKTMSIKPTRELGADGHITVLEPINIQGKIPGPESDWLLNIANYLDKIYSGSSDFVDETTLAYANHLDRVYTAVADEAKKIPGTIGTGVGNLVKPAVDPLTGGGALPYVLGAAAALALIFYGNKLLRR